MGLWYKNKTNRCSLSACEDLMLARKLAPDGLSSDLRKGISPAERSGKEITSDISCNLLNQNAKKNSSSGKQHPKTITEALMFCSAQRIVLRSPGQWLNSCFVYKLFFHSMAKHVKQRKIM